MTGSAGSASRIRRLSTGFPDETPSRGPARRHALRPQSIEPARVVEADGDADQHEQGDEFPDQRAVIVSRIRVGSCVVDEERISGRSEDDLHAVAIYHIDGDGLIDRVRLLR